MCGICGVLYFNRKRFLNKSTIQKMNNSIIQRGPDEEGYYINENIGLGVRRLAIIDIEGGKQPVSNEIGTLQATLNGELYNYKEIKKYGLRTTHRFRSNSDTEVIPHLYEDYGEQFIKKINGMFAIALWDERQQTLLLYRDRLGIKPLYYYHDNRVFVWGSEIKAILASGLVERCIDPRAIELFFRFGYVPAPYCIFKGVKKLLPGHYIRIKDGAVNTQPYWDIRNKICSNNPKYAEDELLELLKQSVDYRLISDVPLGAFLSGGLDSSFVVALMQERMDSPVETFSIKFVEKGFDESQYARRISSFLGTRHFEFQVRPNPKELISSIFPYFDEPFADESSVPAYYVCKMARQRVTVALSGDGGDELFAGYSKYRTLKAAGIYNRLGPLCSSFLRMGRSLPSKIGNRLTNVVYYGGMNTVEKFVSITEMMSRKQTNDILNREAIPVLADEDIPIYDYGNTISPSFRTIDDELNGWLEIDMKTFLVDDVLTKVDRMSMCHSLEVRVPLLDHRVVEYVVSLPARLKVKFFQGKHIFKSISKKLLPKDIVYRKKHAWNVPIDEWLRNQLYDPMNAVISTKGSGISEILNIPLVQRLADEHRKGSHNHSRLLWNVFVFVIWFDCWGKGRQDQL